MSTTDIVSESSTQLPVIQTGNLSDASRITTSTLSSTPSTIPQESSVASTVAAVSSTVGEQIEIAQITANLRKKLVPILPEFSFSTGINWVEAVNEFAQMVNDLNRIRKSHLVEEV